MQIDLTLNDFQIPAIPDYTPEFGTKKIPSTGYKGGLSTTEVNKNVMMPFVKERPIIVDEDSQTTEVQADCVLDIRAAEEVSVTLGNGAFRNVKIAVYNSSSIAQTLLYNSTMTRTIATGTHVEFVWTGEKWQLSGNSGGSGSVSRFSTMAEAEAAIAIAEGQDGYIPDNGIIIIDEENPYITGEER